MTHNPTPNSRTPHHHVAPRRSHSILPTTNQLSTATSTRSTSKPRHLSHLHSQLAQLSANLSDLENLLRMTAVQAESMRGLGAWCGGMFMAASKVLGEETVANSAAVGSGEGATQGQREVEER